MPRQETVRVIRSDIVSPAGSPAGLEERIQRGRWVWVWGSLSQFICPLEPMAKTNAWQLLPALQSGMLFPHLWQSTDPRC